MSTLRDFGVGKKSLEQWVTEEAGHLCDTFTKEAGRFKMESVGRD